MHGFCTPKRGLVVAGRQAADGVRCAPQQSSARKRRAEARTKRTADLPVALSVFKLNSNRQVYECARFVLACIYFSTLVTSTLAQQIHYHAAARRGAVILLFVH